MKRLAHAVWRGGLKDGAGEITTNSGALSATPYNFGMRFENSPGTNPEELIGAAHAACFSMSGLLQKKFNLPPREIKTQSTVTLDQAAGDWAVTAVHLEVTAIVPGCDEKDFNSAAEAAKENCPVSRLLKAPITMKATLAESSQSSGKVA